MKKTVREVALDLLVDVAKNQAYSNLALNQAIQENDLTSVDAGLLTELVYGTIQWKLTLDYYLDAFLQKGKKLEPWVLSLLEMSVYQMAFLDRIPDHAILHEAVEIAKKRGHKGIHSLVNGVLRNIQRQGLPKIKGNELEQLSLQTSHPLWLVQMWVEQYGLAKAKTICEANQQPPIQTARVNETKTTREQVLAQLEAEGYTVEASPTISESIHCKRGNLAHTQSYRNGELTIQDESSMLVATVLDPKPGEQILDACSAPGGKTTHIAEKMLGQGKIIALDIHRHKTKLVRQAAARLGLTNIEVKEMDARHANQFYPPASFDRILVDAPCSGLGVLRRKPDAKYAKQPTDIARLQSIQLDILQSLADLLKPGGTIVYSTCTINQQENADVTAAFLTARPDFEADETLAERLPEKIRSLASGHQLQIFPDSLNSDGFYIAAFRRKC